MSNSIDMAGENYEKPNDIRLACRSGTFQSQTSGHCNGYVQCNLCILPKEYAFDFLLFCQRNPKPCPLIEVLEEGQYCYNDIDIRTDLPKYRVYRDGILTDEVFDISDLWQNDFVTFLIGCSFSFEDAMIRTGIPIRHLEGSSKLTVPMYNTNISCKSAGLFSGNMVVSMRPMTSSQSIHAVEVTSRYPRVHGSPIHIGNPSQIGISDINKPDYGDAVIIHENEVPVFWSCGVTPQAIVLNSKPKLCITHAPGHMLVTNIKNDSLSVS